MDLTIFNYNKSDEHKNVTSFRFCGNELYMEFYSGKEVTIKWDSKDTIHLSGVDTKC